ncbi:spore coat protein B [Neobacillus niacini]|nr:spore coat protein B [Neobacillus niacini]
MMFLGRMKSFLGKMVKIDQGFQEAGVGRLLGVYDDYLVLLTEEDGVVYYNNDHIESVTENTKEFNIVSPEDIEYNKANNLLNLLENQKLKWVKINSDGPVKIEGVLYDVNNDIISLIYDEEIVYVSFNHLHNISID